jgi:hypothetical protein
LNASGHHVTNTPLIQLASGGAVDLSTRTLKNGLLSGIAYKEGTPTVASGKLTTTAARSNRSSSQPISPICR